MVQENTNKAILINSIILYVKLGVSTIAGLLTTRFALGALGATDYGLFSVVGGIISFIAIFNTIMLSTTNRFIAIAIGKNDADLINNTFNANLTIHLFIAIITILVAYPIGEWYINRYVSFDGDISIVKQVYHITIIGSVISFVGVPFNGLLVAKERFIVFSLVDVISSILKCVGAYTLYYIVFNRLYFYAGLQAFLTAVPTIVFWSYCKNKFSDICKFKLVKNIQLYKEVMGFSVWIGYGAIAYIGKSQGAALIVNRFFNTVMNAALGVANAANSMIMTIGNTIGRSISPQIVKSYAAGEMARSQSLVSKCSKFTFLALLITASPFLIEPEYIFQLWLGTVPEHTALFIRLLIIDSLIAALNAGIPDLIQATGRIKKYQLYVNTISLLSIVAGFLVLKYGLPVYWLFIMFILFSIIIFFVRQSLLCQLIDFDIKSIIKEAYAPCILVSILLLPFYIVHSFLPPLLSILLFALFAIMLSILIGLSKSERQMLFDFLKQKIHAM